jgi:hypothetical protein
MPREFFQNQEYLFYLHYLTSQMRQNSILITKDLGTRSTCNGSPRKFSFIIDMRYLLRM